MLTSADVSGALCTKYGRPTGLLRQPERIFPLAALTVLLFVCWLQVRMDERTKRRECIREAVMLRLYAEVRLRVNSVTSGYSERLRTYSFHEQPNLTSYS